MFVILMMSFLYVIIEENDDDDDNNHMFQIKRGYKMIFEKVKDQMDRRAFAELGEKELKEIVEKIAMTYKAADFGEEIPSSYFKLQD